MRKTIPALLCSLLLAVLRLSAQQAGGSDVLPLDEALGKLVAENSTILIQEALERNAFISFRDVISQSYPQIFFQTDASQGEPLYVVSHSVRPSRTEVVSGETPAEAVTGVGQTTHVFSPRFTVSQLLPTAGTLNLSLGNRTTIENSDGNPSISQLPSLSLALTQQPLFLNGKILDLALFGATLRSSRIAYEKQSVQKRAAVNSSITGAAELYLNGVYLRKQSDQLQSAIEVTKERLNQLQVSLKQGVVSPSDVRELELTLRDQQENLLNVKYSLREAVLKLSRMIGVQDLTTDMLSDTFSAPALDADRAALLAEAIAANADVTQNALDLEQTKLKGVIDSRQYASQFSLAFSLSPKYPPDRDPLSKSGGYAYDSFSGSFSDLFGDGSSWDYSLGIGLQVPIFNGGRRKHQVQTQEQNEKVAVENLAVSKADIADQLDLLFMRREIQRERIDILQESRDFKQQLLSQEEKLLELKSSTTTKVAEARVELEKTRNDLWNARAQLYLNTLKILALAGKNLAGYQGVTAGS